MNDNINVDTLRRDSKLTAQIYKNMYIHVNEITIRQRQNNVHNSNYSSPYGLITYIVNNL